MSRDIRLRGNVNSHLKTGIYRGRKRHGARDRDRGRAFRRHCRYRIRGILHRADKQILEQGREHVSAVSQHSLSCLGRANAT